MTALLRTELVKAVRRTRTYVVALGMVGLPTLIVVAIHARGNRPDRDNGFGLFRLAQQSGLLVPAAVLSVMSGFLLVVVAASFAGDTVAGDASWGSLRYLLMRPVPRGRLLAAKTAVAGALIWASTILVAVAALVGGVLLFGAHAVRIPPVGTLIAPGVRAGIGGGFRLTEGALVARVALATAYVAFGYTALLAIGTFCSTLTDSAAGAIGATVGVYIVSEILGGITQLGTMRYGFPTYYLDSWQSIFTSNDFSHDMIAGAVVQVAYFVVFATAAVLWFRRKDIRS